MLKNTYGSIPFFSAPVKRWMPALMRRTRGDVAHTSLPIPQAALML